MLFLFKIVININEKLSKYVFAYSYDLDKTILFNSLNHSVVLIENEKFLNNCEKLTIQERRELNELDFFLEDADAETKYINDYENFRAKTLNIIIEMTQECNLNCVYCYQKNWDAQKSISIHTRWDTEIRVKTGSIFSKHIDITGFHVLLF